MPGRVFCFSRDSLPPLTSNHPAESQSNADVVAACNREIQLGVAVEVARHNRARLMSSRRFELRRQKYPIPVAEGDSRVVVAGVGHGTVR